MNSAQLLLTAIALAGLLAAVGLGFRHFVHRGLAPERVPEHRSPGDLGLSFEVVSIPTANDKRLFAWLVPAPRAEISPAVIVLHGWGGNAEMMLPLLLPLHQSGFVVLLVDARCHGRSDEDSFASMPRFAEDLEHALDWLQGQPSVDRQAIALVGHSVGAGAALLLAARRDDVAAVVSLAAFAHPAAMMRRFLAAKRVPWLPFGWLVLRYVESVIGRRFDDIAPVTSIGRIGCPTLLIHGADDTTVPASEARSIHDARSGDHVVLRIVAGSHDDFGDGDQAASEVAEVVAFLRHCRRPAAPLDAMPRTHEAE